MTGQVMLGSNKKKQWFLQKNWKYSGQWSQKCSSLLQRKKMKFSSTQTQAYSVNQTQASSMYYVNQSNWSTQSFGNCIQRSKESNFSLMAFLYEPSFLTFFFLFARTRLQEMRKKWVESFSVQHFNGFGCHCIGIPITAVLNWQHWRSPAKHTFTVFLHLHVE